MRVVVDASVVAAALVRPRGWTAQELSRTDVLWFAPGAMFLEVEEHAGKLAESAGCSREALLRRLRNLGNVKPVPERDLLAALDHPLVARARSVDPDDETYFAAVVASAADYFWTRDHRLLSAFPEVAVLIVP